MSTTTPRERGMLFSAPMVRALLAGTKTQTRRALKPAPAPNHPNDGGTKWVRNRELHEPVGSVGHLTVREKMGLRCPYGQPGDRLWVRETFAHIYSGSSVPEQRRSDDVVYAADGFTPDRYVYGPWKPSIHMPRWASRITLEITDVRVERLQSISVRDAIAEGCSPLPPHPACSQVLPEDYLAGYRALWEQINGPGSWSVNPWVWVVEFKRVEDVSR